MNFFSKIYQKVIEWTKHPHAPFYLAGLSASEAIFFPIPPDVMLAPMVLSKPEHAWRYATLTTLFSVLGGLIGYMLGMFLLTLVQNAIIYFGYEAAYVKVQTWFLNWGFWAIFLAGFTPIPYKLFTVAAGASSMPLLPFILGSLVGRGGRFYLVSAVIRWGGKKMESLLLRYIEWLGWLLIVLVGAYLVSVF